MKRKFWIAATAVIIIGLIIAAVTTLVQRKPNDVKFGAILSLTGDAASYGTMMKNGMEIAQDEVNTSGGINGKKLDMIYEDSQFDPTDAASAAQKLINVDHVQVITGITGSKNALAVAPIANANKVVIVDALSSAAELTTKGGKYYFRIMPSDDFSGMYVAQWAISNAWKNGVILYADDDWGKGIENSAASKFESLGGKIALSEPVETGTNDFRTVVTKVAMAKPDVVFLFAYAPEAAIFVKQMREFNVKTHYIGSDNLSAGEFAKVGADVVDGVMFDLPAEGSGPAYDSFRSAYKAKFGEYPSVNSIKAYDVVKLAAFVVSKVGYDGVKIQEFLADSLANDNYHGASGKIVFDQNGDIENPQYDKMIYENGQYVKMSTEK
ncbi:MAG TPA: penicillin-binding protein activator [Nitrospirota bacterium]|nr:penicillin-binding protein activator [Candidatus Acidoferrales bacterium]HUL00021.1 penicillin-binding protein activator [Nitrospirota bacterium]